MIFKTKLKELRRLVIRTVVRRVARAVAVSPASALIIAPHPDDETFGCGGLIALKCQMGVKVSVVFLTDGEASHKGCCKTSPEIIGRARREMAYEVCSGLGVCREHIHWLGLPDGSIPQVGDPNFLEAVQRLSGLLELLAPGEVFAPHPHDSWPDHEAASELVRHALSRRNNSSTELIYYPVWFWHNLRLRMLPTVICDKIERVDISEVMHVKTKASGVYFNVKNTTCGMPISGTLPEDLKKYFANENEIFMLVRKQDKLTSKTERRLD